ncbi:MAG: hypothetical protein IT310_10955 [Anaerolineales bacterium]|nr:hypothetical protein [Anaerolineales bacterium]
MNRFGQSFLVLALVSCACVLQPTADLTPQAALPTGSVLFQDDFSKPVSGWNRLQGNDGVMDYDGGGYRMLVNAAQTNLWSTLQLNLADVRLEVDTGKLAGPDENRIGLVCRLSGADYYFFLLSSDGYYGIGVSKGGQAVLLGQSEMQPSPNIHTGLAVNHLRADCVGNTLTFFINGIQVAQTQDSSLTSGDVGLLAGSFATSGVDVIFDNFVALQP